MILEDTPPALAELLEAAPPAPQHIALHVTVSGAAGERAYWMTEGGILFFRGLDGRLLRANEEQRRHIARGMDLARRSPAFDVRGQIVDASVLDAARGLLHN